MVLLGLAAIGIALAMIVLALAYPNLPSLETLTDYRPKIPLRVYTADGYLIGEYGEERRAVISIQEVPAVMKQAILAAEDDRFYQHSGVDYPGILRAASANLVGGGKRQGASTITQQVARNFFLSGEKTYTRKLYEALLSFKIENNLSKDQILELYINQIFLGQRAYGFAAAAQIYFGKPLKDISIAEAAMLAGLPKAPSVYNPIVNPKRAKIRQQYVLRRMHELGNISDEQYEAALKEPLVIKRELAGYAVHAEYAAEMARQIATERFPEDVYSRGLKVYTTLIKADQEAAYASLRRGVMDYDRRHGYRGAESYLDMKDIKSDQDEAIDEALQDIPDAGDLIPALVLAADSKQIHRLPQGRRHRHAFRRRHEVRGRDARRQGAGQQAHQARRDHPSTKERQGRLADQSVARGGVGVRRGQPEIRGDSRPGRRFRLQPQQVQSCNPGLAATGIQLQALHLLGRPRKRLQSKHLHQ